MSRSTTTVRLLTLAFVLLLGVLAPTSPAPAATEAATEVAFGPARWETSVFARVPAPGYPAYTFVHRNGRVYAGSYVNPRAQGQRSRVFEWDADGTLLRSWTVPGQVLGQHGVQVANQTRDGRLVLLETSTATVRTLDLRTGAFRTVARFPKGVVPNYATWGPRGWLYVTDYAHGDLWRVPPGRAPRKWFSSRHLQGIKFGTTGIDFRPATREFLITQQTTLGGSTLPTNGALFALPLRPDGRPGTLRTLWRSRPAELPDGFGIGRSGRIYVSLAGPAAQLVELTPQGKEVGRFPKVPLLGDNGSPIPFDTPCSATFLGTTVLVANQSAIAGKAAHQAILAVEVGETGRRPWLPKRARFPR
ncbi:SMP-30/gluconolactonase/LRE family protein [Nocardioides sp. SYSU D00038]|uniref:SMP-30/gluconolactonase/LRE family protein n=1 Tax=Nocardioides sp. SYSU D00038 TaxID=2812554 RepID=UPI00196770FE|nr:hypothetical protein [Nocardioides sp. SYSU D00038]